MDLWNKLKPWTAIVTGLVVLYVLYGAYVYFNQRSFMYFPSTRPEDSPLEAWIVDGHIIGYGRKVAKPHAVWLMTHGNAGQAGQRSYVLAHMQADDALYVLEYPGYGLRAGNPSRESFNRAALDAYLLLRKQYPGVRIGVIGESIGSGPASFLTVMSPPPDKIVLIVPFDVFSKVAADHMPFLPVDLMVEDNWNNVHALALYRGPVEIYGALDDRIIPIEHARALAASVRGSIFHEIEGGHNDWSRHAGVRISF